MAQADPNAGLIYVCNPNNPTGSITPKDDIEYLVAHKPEGAIVLLDEAYIHLSKTAVPASPLVAADKDVIILRTFSKLYGMAGLRAGAALGRPDLLAKLRGYGAGALPVTGMVGAIASLKAKGLVEQRRKVIAEIREETAEWLDKRGFAVLPSEANMLMVDVRRPGREVFQALLEEKVAIGRTWRSMPNHVRISIGTREEMAKFRAAFGRHECLSCWAGERGGTVTATAGAAGGRRSGRHRRPGRLPYGLHWHADGPAARAGPLHLDPDGADHVALGRNPVLIGGTASHRAVHRGGRACQGVGGAAKVCLRRGLHDDLLRPPAGPARGQGAARGRLGLLVRCRCHDGDPPAPHAARPAQPAGQSTRQPRGTARQGREQLGRYPVGAAASGFDRGRWQPSPRRGVGRGRPRPCSASPWPPPWVICSAGTSGCSAWYPCTTCWFLSRIAEHKGGPAMSMSTPATTFTQYQHLEPRPGSNYRQLFLKGRHICAAVVDETIRRSGSVHARGVCPRLSRLLGSDPRGPRLRRPQPTADRARTGPRGRRRPRGLHLPQRP